MSSRRKFIKQSAMAAAGTYIGAFGFSAKSYGNILGANDRVRIGAVGFSDRFRQTLFPCFLNHYKELNFDLVAVSDIWKLRREEGQAFLKNAMGHDIKACFNNEELYATKDRCCYHLHGRFSACPALHRSNEGKKRCLCGETIC